KQANEVFKTDFSKIGVNYGSDLSEWLVENCPDFCDEKGEAQYVEPVSQHDLKKADDAARAMAETSDVE
ncbi:MAG: hypothetical protein LBF28_01680, partial [Rickettsiales bacterium]|nr:hypothetical protein [Rickettsiales bacterium]